MRVREDRKGKGWGGGESEGRDGEEGKEREGVGSRERRWEGRGGVGRKGRIRNGKERGE